jgi:hypothetical protein
MKTAGRRGWTWFIDAWAQLGKEITMRAGRWEEADANGTIASGRGVISVTCDLEAGTGRRCRVIMSYLGQE